MRTHLLGGARMRPSRHSRLGRPENTRARARVRGFACITAFVIFAVAILHPLPSRAQPAPSFGALFREAEVSAPRLMESQANVRAAAGRAVQAGALPNPSAGFEVENLGANSKAFGFAAEQTTLSINAPIELGGKRGARVAAGAPGPQYVQA